MLFAYRYAFFFASHPQAHVYFCVHMRRLVKLSSGEIWILEKPGRSDPKPDRREAQIGWPPMGPENQVTIFCHWSTSPTSDLLVGESFVLRLIVLPRTEQEERQDIKAHLRKPSIFRKKLKEIGLTKQLKAIFLSACFIDQKISQSSLETWDFCEMLQTLKSAKKIIQNVNTWTKWAPFLDDFSSTFKCCQSFAAYSWSLGAGLWDWSLLLSPSSCLGLKCSKLKAFWPQRATKPVSSSFVACVWIDRAASYAVLIQYALKNELQ